MQQSKALEQRELESSDAPPLDYSFRDIQKLEGILIAIQDIKTLIPRGKKERKIDLASKEKQIEQPLVKDATQIDQEKMLLDTKESQMDDQGQKTQNDDLNNNNNTDDKEQNQEKEKAGQKKVEQKQSPESLVPQNNIAGLLITQQNIPLNGKIIGGKLQENKNLNQDNKLKIKLNKIQSIANFQQVMDSVLNNLKNVIIDTVVYNLRGLKWVDLSYNQIVTLDYNFKDLPQLQSLYLHCNLISDNNELNNLAHLQNLRSLTIHGNPIEQITNIRIYAIANLQQLKRLNSVLISKKERDNANNSKLFKYEAKGILGNESHVAHKKEKQVAPKTKPSM